MQKVATLTARGQLTLPGQVRRALGVAPGDRVVLEVIAGKLVITPFRGTFSERIEGLGAEVWRAVGGGNAWLASEREAWGVEPARRGR